MSTFGSNPTKSLHPSSHSSSLNQSDYETFMNATSQTVHETKDPFPDCQIWTKRELPLVLNDPDDINDGHFFAFFHNILNLTEAEYREDGLAWRDPSPGEKLELWQWHNCFHLVYIRNNERMLRVDINTKKITRITPQFPRYTLKDPKCPVIEDKDVMNLASLCLFLQNKLKQVRSGRNK